MEDDLEQENPESEETPEETPKAKAEPSPDPEYSKKADDVWNRAKTNIDDLNVVRDIGALLQSGEIDVADARVAKAEQIKDDERFMKLFAAGEANDFDRAMKIMERQKRGY